jgi:Organic solute transporter Ostalpha
LLRILTFLQIIIDFAVSSGTVTPSKTISDPDLRVGIPSMLLCIEMTFFSILHLWAYPWQEYDVKRSVAIAAETPGGFDASDPHPQYLGGPFGYKAFLEAYNPWDIIKAVGRGFKWMAVGRRYRTEDISYKQHGDGTALADAAGFKGNGAYQKLPDSREQSPARGSYQRPTAYGVAHPSGSRPGTSDGTGDGDMGTMPHHPYDAAAYHDVPPTSTHTAYGGAGAQDTAYHGAVNPPAPMPMPDANRYR